MAKKAKSSNETRYLYDIEQEKTLLGTVLCNPKDIDLVRHLDPHDFYDEKHRVIFEAVLSILENGDHLDFLVVEKELRPSR